MQPVIVSTTCSSEKEAKHIADIVLKKRLAACIQISPITSMYWWNNRIESEGELIVAMKSERSLFDRLAVLIGEHHSYDVPEIIATDIVAVETSYREWLTTELTDLK